jgi:hypothetical protein
LTATKVAGIQTQYDDIVSAWVNPARTAQTQTSTYYYWGYQISAMGGTVDTPIYKSWRIPGYDKLGNKYLDIVYTGSQGALYPTITYGTVLANGNATNQYQTLDYMPRLYPVMTTLREYIANNYALNLTAYNRVSVQVGGVGTMGVNMSGEVSTADLAQVSDDYLVVDHYEIYTNKADGTEQDLLSSYNLTSGAQYDTFIPVQFGSDKVALQAYLTTALSNVVSGGIKWSAFVSSTQVLATIFRGLCINNVGGGLRAVSIYDAPFSTTFLSAMSDKSATATTGFAPTLKARTYYGSVIFGTKKQWAEYFSGSGMSWSWDRDKVIAPDDGGLIKPVYPGQPDNPTDDEDGDGDNISDDIVYPDPDIIPIGLHDRYWLNSVGVNSLKDFLFSETFLNNPLRLWTDPGEYIVNLSYYPFDGAIISRYQDIVNVSIGGIGSDISAIAMRTSDKPYIYGGSVTISPYYNNYLDYAPYTSIDIYIPYVGVRQLNVNQVVGHTVKLLYCIDFNSQLFTAMLGLDGDGYVADGIYIGSVGQVLTQYSGTMSVQCPLSGTSNNQTVTNAIQGALGIVSSAGTIVGGALSGNVGAVVGGAVGAANTLVGSNDIMTPQVYGSVTPLTGIFAPQNAYVIINRPITAKPAAWQELHGSAAGYSGTVSDFSGYLQCSDVYVTPGNMTDQEQAEIIRLLQGGIYL